jgi:hypothetical protein
MDPQHHPLVRVIQDMYRMKVGSPQLPPPTRHDFTLPKPIGETVVNKTGPWITSQTSTQLVWPIDAVFINTHLTIRGPNTLTRGWRSYEFYSSWKPKTLEIHPESEPTSCQLYNTSGQLYPSVPTGKYLFFGLVDFSSPPGVWGYLHPITD